MYYINHLHADRAEVYIDCAVVNIDIAHPQVDLKVYSTMSQEEKCRSVAKLQKQ